MHLENHCNEAGRLSMQQRLIDEINAIIKHEEEVIVKAETFQDEASIQ